MKTKNGGIWGAALVLGAVLAACSSQPKSEKYLRGQNTKNLTRLGEALGAWYGQHLSYPKTLQALVGFALMDLPREAFSDQNRQSCDRRGGWCYNPKTGLVFPNHEGKDQHGTPWHNFSKIAQKARDRAIQERLTFGKLKDGLFTIRFRRGQLVANNGKQTTSIDLKGNTLLTLDLRDLNADGRQDVLYTLQGSEAEKRPLIWRGSKMVEGRHWRTDPNALTPGM